MSDSPDHAGITAVRYLKWAGDDLDRERPRHGTRYV